MKNSKKKEQKLRVFEAFAGIGAQAAALERLDIDYEIVGISDWFIDAIECYAAIHHQDKRVEVPRKKSEVIEYLSKFTFSADSVHPYNISRLSEDKLRDLYRANKKCNNFGSVCDINANDLPDFDLLVYSFPCQDLSTGGLGKGMKKGSGTRSGLLWEIERILIDLHKMKRLPEYLLLENVKTIKADSNIEDLKQWLSFLESIGYKNDECMLLNSLDFGVPQDRERAFIVSHLKTQLDVEEKIQKKPRKYIFENFFRDNYSDPTLRAEADIAQLNKTPSREVMWEINGRPLNKDTTVRTITCNMDRTHCAALFPYTGAKGESYRRPTIREAFLLMGFSEQDYENTLSLAYSYRKMNKLIGNSIVVDVLVEIFRAMFEEKYGRKKR
jgi:DNA (cytosine-5)-methyltransferase 1